MNKKQWYCGESVCLVGSKSRCHEILALLLPAKLPADKLDTVWRSLRFIIKIKGGWQVKRKNKLLSPNARYIQESLTSLI